MDVMDSADHRRHGAAEEQGQAQQTRENVGWKSMAVQDIRAKQGQEFAGEAQSTGYPQDCRGEIEAKDGEFDWPLFVGVFEHDESDEMAS